MTVTMPRFPLPTLVLLLCSSVLMLACPAEDTASDTPDPALMGGEAICEDYCTTLDNCGYTSEQEPWSSCVMGCIEVIEMSSETDASCVSLENDLFECSATLSCAELDADTFDPLNTVCADAFNALFNDPVCS